MSFSTGPEYALALDEQDPLARFRNRFVIDDPSQVYLDGNSLGRLPKETVARAQEVVGDQWGKGLIGSWNEGWCHLPEQVGAKIARLLGAEAGEVVVADSTSVNLFKLAVAALRARPERRRIVTDDLNFPSDLYILQSALKLVGGEGRLEIIRSPDGLTGPVEAIGAAIDTDTALVALSHTAFKSAYVYDMAEVTALAHRSGAMMLWDLSHSAGAMPLSLAEAEVDLAVGCTYKYLNGGPGAPAFLYVRRDLQERLENPVAGWFGQQDPFAFALEYQPVRDLRRFLTGSPPVVSLALIEPGVDLLLEAGLERIREKSIRQTEYLIALWEALLAPLGFTLRSPRESHIRGSHVSLGHPEGLRIAQALVEQMCVVPDFRHPDNIRLGVCPLYTTYREIHAAAIALEAIVRERIYEQYSPERHGVT
jgi:kynureninase